LPALLGGDVDRQHAAIWTYLSDGPLAKFPEGISRQNVEVVVGGEAVVYRGKLWEAGFRGIATGHPGGLNVAFDAEECRLALLWRGKFYNAGPHWTSQGMGQIRPLGTDVVVFPHGSAFAVLPDASTAWPADAPRTLGLHFGGYQIDPQKRPTLFYTFGGKKIDDFITPAEAGKPALRRTITLADDPPDKLYQRLGAGKIAPAGQNAWRVNDQITITVKTGAPLLRGESDKQELLVPVKGKQLEVEYAW
jgi:hypothetical protein